MHSALDLLSHYARYHRDQRNIATHFVGVPLIVFSLGLLLSQPAFPIGDLVLTPAWVLYVPVVLWYLRRHVVLGLATSAGVGLLTLAAHQLSLAGVLSATGWGLACFVVGWLFQWLGHWYEGRRPAFVDDVASLLVAPMFVVAEALFGLGWNAALRRDIEDRVGKTHLRDLAHPA